MSKSLQFLVTIALLIVAFYSWQSGWMSAWWNNDVPEGTTLADMGQQVFWQSLLVVGCVAIAMIAGLQSKAESIVDNVRELLTPPLIDNDPDVATRLALLEDELARVKGEENPDAR